MSLETVRSYSRQYGAALQASMLDFYVVGPEKVIPDVFQDRLDKRHRFTLMPNPVCLPLLERLISFDTTSHQSNLAMIGFINDYLLGFGIDSELTYNEDRSKANLFASIGPADRPGIVLSGHTDVVPVAGQNWRSDPYRLSRHGSRLYGRGTADMKSSIAVCLALAPHMTAVKLGAPIHMAFSYDEEIGCVGVRKLIAELKMKAVKPRACVVGEPTCMQLVTAHKGKMGRRCIVHGSAFHSSMPQYGVNAIEVAAEIISRLKCFGLELRKRHTPVTQKEAAGFNPPYTTINTGVIHGGSALNIIPDRCSFDFEVRNVPGDDIGLLWSELRKTVESELLTQMQTVAGDSGFDWPLLSEFPSLLTADDADITKLIKKLLGTNETEKVSFGTEGGLFQLAGIPTVVCGPGNVAQAHRPNEYIDIEQLVQYEGFVRRLIDYLVDP